MKNFVMTVIVVLMFIVSGAYALLQFVGNNDFYYQIRGGRIYIADGICWKSDLHELPMDGRVGFSAKINSRNRNAGQFSTVLTGEYVLSPNKQLLRFLLDTLNVSALTPRQAIERKLQNEITDALSAASLGCFAAEDIKTSVEKEINGTLVIKGFRLHADYMDFRFSPYIQKIIGEAQKSFEKVRQARIELEKAQAKADSLLNEQKLKVPEADDYTVDTGLTGSSTSTY